MIPTVRVDSLPHRKWKEIKQEPGTAGPGNMLGCCLIYFHFRWGKLSTLTVLRPLLQPQHMGTLGRARRGGPPAHRRLPHSLLRRGGAGEISTVEMLTNKRKDRRHFVGDRRRNWISTRGSTSEAAAVQPRLRANGETRLDREERRPSPLRG